MTLTASPVSGLEGTIQERYGIGKDRVCADDWCNQNRWKLGWQDEPDKEIDL